MELEIITMYVVCDDYLKATQYREDSQTEMTTAQVMTTALVAAKFFKNCLEHGRVFLKEAGYIRTPTGTFRMLSESRLNRRVHAIPEQVWLGVFYALAQAHKQVNDDQDYIVDSLPVAICDNYRIGRCRLYGGEDRAAFRGYIASKRRYFYGLRLHVLVTASGRSLPAWMCPSEEATLAKNSGTCPPITSFSAGPPPLYGTCTRLTPARCSNSAPARCWAEPLPEDA